ncbi:integral membrane sensor signal transduction histidine kinase [Methylobacterium sp. 4-46]|uniref:sensor histidine kinase n=1 Tax=unclassified Methylobacterium TaxID=2615210 RepID=UPI000165C98D|nr:MULTISPECIES: sensor histidine kinase [Methylobacterium]ACA14799.1 integral membrane sensor signal transduction histidine kinase [Methylobacterium sp. 4-46]WFT83745.1 sensor histidine kinase [Methylobacterium nodulans]
MRRLLGAGAPGTGSEADPDAEAPREPLSLRLVGRWIAQRASSSLTRRIVVLNLAGLIALLVGFLYLNQFRQGLIEARVKSLLTQGDIIAGAIAASATVDTDAISIDPDRLLQLQAGDPGAGAEEPVSALEFSLNPERVAPLLRRLITPTGTRARVYDRDGSNLIDSRALYVRGDLARGEVPVRKERPSLMERAWDGLRQHLPFPHREPGPEDTGPSDGRSLPEVQRALAGSRGTLVRRNAHGETIVSVAVPIMRARTVRGALLLSTQEGDIDKIIASERFALLQVFLIAALVMVVLSLLVAGQIVGPVSRLSEAAERVRLGIRSRQEIPDFTTRSDEIGHLSRALRDMTQALYRRLDAIENFAADVSHELKNPLTSLRSAVETLPLAKTDESRGRLMQIIQHDVKRLDRLISDISDASRLDAELARAEAARVDLKKLLTTVTSVANERRRPRDAAITFTVEAPPAGIEDPFAIIGHDSRLGQVVNNLLDNARSFSPKGATVRVNLRRLRNTIELTVEDDGPGIPPHALERIFERFYTDRPEQGFGQNSGLGLSISRQIVQAHRGTIRAENRLGPPGEDGEPCLLGARFVVRIPGLHR